MNLGKLLNFSKQFPLKVAILLSKIGENIHFGFFLFSRVMRKYLQSNMAHGMWPINAFSFPSSHSEKNYLNKDGRKHLFSYK